MCTLLLFMRILKTGLSKQALSFSADAMWLLSAGKDPEQNVVIWDVATGTALTSGTTSQPVTALSWRPQAALPAFITMSKVQLTSEPLRPDIGCSLLCCWVPGRCVSRYSLLHCTENTRLAVLVSISS